MTLLSSSTSWGIGEQTRNTVSTPCRADCRLDLSAKSAITRGTPLGALRASSAPRYKALTGFPVFCTADNTSRPTVPEAPVTSIMVTSGYGQARRARDWERSPEISRPWYTREETGGRTHFYVSPPARLASLCVLPYCELG